MYKDNAVGNVVHVGETGRVFGTTVQHDWAIFQCRWQARFDAHLNRLQGHRRQPIARSGKLYDVLIRGERWIVLMLSTIVRDVQRQRCCKRGSGDGQRLSLDYGTTERSFNAVERRGSTLTWTVFTAADSEERQICTTCLFAESVGLWKRRRSYLYVCFLVCSFSCMLSPIVIVEHTSAWEGVGGRGEFWRGIPPSNTKDQLPKPQQQLLRPRSGPSSTYPNNRVEKQQVEQISKKGIKLILKTIGNRKGDCAWSCSRWQTQPEKICKLQSTNQYNVRSEWHWFVRCDLQIFSGCVCHLEQLHAQSPFLFPIVFSINNILYTGMQRKPKKILQGHTKKNIPVCGRQVGRRHAGSVGRFKNFFGP